MFCLTAPFSMRLFLITLTVQSFHLPPQSRTQTPLPNSPKFSSVWIRSRNWDKWLTVTLDYTSKTACGAPTTVSATKKMKKGGSSTISWSGATDGVANAIAEYRVYYKIGSAPTTSDKYVKAASGATSVSISNKTIGAKKGQTVYFKV